MPNEYKLYLQTKLNVQMFGNQYGDEDTLRILEEQLGIKEMTDEEHFKIVTNTICQLLEDITFDDKQQELYKMQILLVLTKLCESKEIFDKNMNLLDREAANGSVANYQKKFNKKRF